MFSSIRPLLKNDPNLRWLLLAMLLLQIVFSYNAVGFLHPDQHFQIIEFSQYHLGNPNGTAPIWELKAMIRPSLQIHLFSAFFLLCQSIGIDNPFTQLTILQLLTGVSMFLLFSGMTLYYVQDTGKKIRYIALLLLNCSWAFPFIRSLFSSEILASWLFFAALWWYAVHYLPSQKIATAVWVGFVFGLSFYARFQMGLAIAGWCTWQVLIAKQYKGFAAVMAGLLVSILVNIYLDYLFYHQWIFTPYTYFKVNILGGVANSFGTSSFLNYIAILAAVVSAPLLSVLLFGVGLYSCLKQYKHPLVLSVLFFMVGHCMVGHKEERFLFPIFNVLPILIAWQLPALYTYTQQCRLWLRGVIKACAYMGIGLNVFLLVVFLFTPYAQTVHFARSLQQHFAGTKTTIHCIHRSPLETESTLPLTFYQKGLPNLQFVKIASQEAFDSLTQKPALLAITFNDIAGKRNQLYQMGYRPVQYSSTLLWRINEYLHQKHINTINDIWVLYQLQP